MPYYGLAVEREISKARSAARFEGSSKFLLVRFAATKFRRLLLDTMDGLREYQSVMHHRAYIYTASPRFNR
jgi:hypothetical protein